jgi:hypothetical protein
MYNVCKITLMGAAVILNVLQNGVGVVAQILVLFKISRVAATKTARFGFSSNLHIRNNPQTFWQFQSTFLPVAPGLPGQLHRPP